MGILPHLLSFLFLPEPPDRELRGECHGMFGIPRAPPREPNKPIGPRIQGKVPPRTPDRMENILEPSPPSLWCSSWDGLLWLS